MPERKPVLACQNSLQEDLKAYLDNELPPARRATVERHLSACAACQAERESLRQLSAQLTETLPVVAAPLPSALRTRILAALPEAPTPRPVLLPFWRRPGPMAAFGGALAMGCAFLLWLKIAPPQSSVPLAEDAKRAAQVAVSAPTAMGAAAAPAQTERANLSAAAPRASKSLAVIRPAAEALSEGKAARAVASVTVTSRGAAMAQKASPRSASMALATSMQEESLEAKLSGESRGGMKKEKAKNMASESGRSFTSDRRAVPTVFTLTVPAGKRTETLEAIRKLASQLSVTVNADQPELDLRLAPGGREALLDQLKALGTLTRSEGWFNVMEEASKDAHAKRAAKPQPQPQLKLTVIIKELAPEERP